MNTFSTYLVGWDDTQVIKAGVSTNRRWTTFLARGAKLYMTHEADGTAPLCALEARLHAFLGRYMWRAFDDKVAATPFLGSRGAGYSECFWANTPENYRYALAACAGIMLGHGGGTCSNPMPALMHGRTNARTNEDLPHPHVDHLSSPTRAKGEAR